MGVIGEFERGEFLFPVYLQVSSLLQITLSSSDSFDVILKGNTFLILLGENSEESSEQCYSKFASSISDGQDVVQKGVCDQIHLRHTA